MIIVAGPTASGKSALALALAARHDGMIINADAMQCYAELRILTARPSPEDEALAPHRLYGVLPAATPGNAAWWRQAALDSLGEARENGKTPILCGGTGMYMQALLHGIAEIPDPGAGARLAARSFLAEAGPAALHQKLLEDDPETGAKIRPSDSQRLARAYEVWLGTGRGLAYWQALPTEKLTGWAPRMILLDPPRPELREAVETRFKMALLPELTTSARMACRNSPRICKARQRWCRPQPARHWRPTNIPSARPPGSGTRNSLTILPCKRLMQELKTTRNFQKVLWVF